jgi:hypothetical protein
VSVFVLSSRALAGVICVSQVKMRRLRRVLKAPSLPRLLLRLELAD